MKVFRSISMFAMASAVAILPFNAPVFTSGVAHAEECQHSKWGKDDELGAANYVSPERTLAATKLVKKGESHPLGIVVNPGMPAFPPRSLSLQVVAPGQNNGRDTTQDFGWPASYNDDIAQLWFGIGPQIDGLGHLGEKNYYYNCNQGKDIVHITGLKKLGLEKVPPLISRGVLIDMAEYKGVEAMNGGDAITEEDVKGAMEAQGVTINEGDVVLIHTGWTDAKLASAPKEWVSTEPGLDNAASVYLASFNPMAVGSDTWGLEVVPPKKGDRVFYGHVELLSKRGIYILETMNTGRLAEENVSEFMFVLGHARITGTVQMIINPVAMW
ncbi:MAG: cyclase family protein [Rhizobiaceae bacterium]|nr:cyclase family protein [Rhizobiaceae bacterium]